MDKFTTLEDAKTAITEIDRDNYFDFRVDPDSPATSVWSKSALRRFFKDPADGLSGEPIKETAKMAFGKMLDKLVFEPESFKEVYEQTVPGPWNANPARADAARIRKMGKIPMKPETALPLASIKNALIINEASQAQEMIEGTPQVVLTGVFECSYKSKGRKKKLFIPVKGLADSIMFHNDGTCDIYDLKTTSAKNIHEMWKISREFGYAWQDVIYRALTHNNHGDVRNFHLVFAQTDLPNRVQVAKFSDHARNIARSQLQTAIKGICMLAEGYSVGQLYNAVEEFGSAPTWDEPEPLEEAVANHLKDFSLKIHGNR